MVDFQFDIQLSPDYNCVEVELKQEFPVTNPYPGLHIRLYAHLSPEHFNATTLLLPRARDLHTCDICASHACKDCASQAVGRGSRLKALDSLPLWIGVLVVLLDSRLSSPLIK